jgi:hypothetical protein
MYLLGFDDHPEHPDSMLLLHYEQSRVALVAFCNLGLQEVQICKEDPRNHVSIGSIGEKETWF